jgi:hypothetical protein
MTSDQRLIVCQWMAIFQLGKGALSAYTLDVGINEALKLAFLVFVKEKKWITHNDGLLVRRQMCGPEQIRCSFATRCRPKNESVSPLPRSVRKLADKLFLFIIFCILRESRFELTDPFPRMTRVVLVALCRISVMTNFYVFGR